MSQIALEIWDNECARVTFYSVKKEGNQSNETDLFLEKFFNISEYRPYVEELNSLLIDVIGEDYGAIDEFFNRFEDNVFGLPPKGKLFFEHVTLSYPNFPLRLYAMRVCNRTVLVVLFGGGLKEVRSVQEDSALLMKFREANLFARKIEDGINSGMILVDRLKRKLTNFDGSEPVLI
jgi:hypothetical protein